ncbi:MAG TPA: hypothetical protein VGL38_14525 [bacterium]|jgi:hypothetical protein
MKYVCLLGVLLLVTGCAETFTITRGSYYSDFEEANLQCMGTTNHVRLRSGAVIDTQQLILAADSATWLLPDGRRQRIRLWEIARIDNINHRRGARSGAFVGLVAGLGGGIAVSSQIHTHNTLGKIAVGALSGATSAIGGFLGATVGSAIGYRTVIKFDSTRRILADTLRSPARSSAGWAMPGASDSTQKR